MKDNWLTEVIFLLLLAGIVGILIFIAVTGYDDFFSPTPTTLEPMEEPS